MTAVIGALTLLVMMGLVLTLVSGKLPNADALSTAGSPKSYAILESLVGAVAISTLVAESSEGRVGAATIGAAIGLISAIRLRAPSWLSLAMVFSIFYGTVGVLAALIAVVKLFDPTCASEMPVPPLVIVLFVACLAIPKLIASFFGKANLAPDRLAATGLGWFAAVETLSVLASPVGLALFPTTVWYFVALTLFAIIAGVGLGIAPEPVFIAISVALLLASASSVGTSSPCLAANTTAMVTVLVSFLAVYLLAGMLLRWIR